MAAMIHTQLKSDAGGFCKKTSELFCFQATTFFEQSNFIIVVGYILKCIVTQFLKLDFVFIHREKYLRTLFLH